MSVYEPSPRHTGRVWHSRANKDLVVVNHRRKRRERRAKLRDAVRLLRILR